MFVNKLGRSAHRVEQDSKCIESPYHAAQLHAADEIDRYTDVFFTYLIEKDVL